MQSFKAQLKGKYLYITILVSLIIISAPFLASNNPINNPNLTTLILAAILLLGFFIKIRKYVITDNSIEIQFFYFVKNIDIDEIKNIEHQPAILAGSIRTFGIGGPFFGAFGNYRNKQLGSFKAYATNGDDTVLIKLKNAKNIVISPNNAEKFVEKIKEELK